MFIFMNSTNTTTAPTTYTVTKTPGRRWKVSADGVALTETYTTKGEAEAAADVMRLDDEADRAAASEIAADQAAGYNDEPEAPAVDIDAIAAMTHEERVAAARAEYMAVKAAGHDLPTPVLDWMTDPEFALARMATAKPKGTRAARGTIATFEPGDATTHECSCCHTVKPVKAFPTVNGPEVRAERCRACRDGKACE